MQTSTEPTTNRAATAAARAQLMLQRTELRDSMDHRMAEASTMRSDVSDGHGETEHLVVAEQHDHAARLDAITRAALADVDAAIDRIDSGTYGRCIDCGDEIPAERLEILPATPVCVQCQATQERA